MNFFSILKKYKSSAFFILVFSFLSSSSEIVYAQEDTDLGVNEVNETIALGSGSIYEIVGTIINTFLGLLGIIALVMIVYGGYKIMTSGGNEEKVQEGKRTLINATIGLAIILASFAITNFVISSLREATTTDDSGDGAQRAGAPTYQNFSGSGGLGNVIQDHYPGRDETGIKRNSKITVTFNYPVAPETILENTNNTCWTSQGEATTTPQNNPGSVCQLDDNGNPIPYYGDCLKDGGQDNQFNWEEDCDQINTSSVQIAKSTSTDPNQVDLMGATGLISYDFEGGTTREDAQAKTFVFKTNDLLGNNLEKQQHTVNLTDNIKRARVDNQGQNLDLFTGAISNYEWSFETDTNFDFDPPVVTGVYPPKRNPNDLEQIHKNSILQITFSEPMDPTAVQGMVSSSPGSFSNIIFNTSTMDNMEGEWRITNGYKTVEFIPSNTCGTNSCGDPMYCLNIDCSQGNQSCSKELTTLIRTAELVNPNASWEAQPFSGVVDMAGNALDGNKDGNRDGKPNERSSAWNGFNRSEKNADNFFWSYEVINKIDRRIPHIQKINPQVDEDNIAGDTPLRLYFSMPMQYSSFNGISLEEYNTTTAGTGKRPKVPGNNNGRLAPIWYGIDAITTSTNVNNTIGTIATVNHREFGPNDMDLFYTTAVSTSVKGINQNCIYPGLGPDQDSNVCTVNRDQSGGIKSNSGCVGVEMKADKDAGCPYNFAQTTGQSVTSTLSKCRQKLKEQTTNF